MRRVVLACQTVEAELRPLLPPEVQLKGVEQGLHRTPARLKEHLQQEIDSLEADEILLTYGLCGNGVVDLSSATARLVIPRVDDCISILLGSRDRYLEEFRKEPGTYWLSAGWIEHGLDPYKEYKRCLEKYDEDTARWVAHELIKGYTRLALIDTGVGPLAEHRRYAQEFAAFFGLRYEEMAGSDALLSTLLSPDWDTSKFVVVEPGQRVSLELFLPPQGLANG